MLKFLHRRNFLKDYKMDRAKAILIQAEVNAALKEIAKKHGMSVSPARGNYDAVGLKLSVIFGDTATIGTDDINPEYARNLERNGHMYGLDKSFIGKTFNFGQRVGVTFQGLKGKKAAFKTRDGEIRLADAMVVAQILKAAK